VAESVAVGVAATPVPFSVTVCGEPLALSVIVSVPERPPAAVGVKVIEIVQAVPTATLAPQLLVSAKSPDAAIELSVSVAVPELESVTACAALVVPVVCDAKVRLAEEMAAVGVAASPAPLNATICGELLALSVIVSVPVRLPAAVGVKVTEMVQPALAATLVPQLFVWAKSPEAAIDVMVSAAVPELVSVTVCAALVEPFVCEVNVRLVDESVAVGVAATPVPLSITV
jgi:hypothetical protein